MRVRRQCMCQQRVVQVVQGISAKHVLHGQSRGQRAIGPLTKSLCSAHQPLSIAASNAPNFLVLGMHNPLNGGRQQPSSTSNNESHPRRLNKAAHPCPVASTWSTSKKNASPCLPQRTPVCSWTQLASESSSACRYIARGQASHPSRHTQATQPAPADRASMTCQSPTPRSPPAPGS